MYVFVHVLKWRRCRAVCLFSFLKDLLYLMCVNVLPEHMYVYYVSAQCPQRSEKGFRFPETEVRMVINHAMCPGN